MPNAFLSPSDIYWNPRWNNKTKNLFVSILEEKKNIYKENGISLKQINFILMCTAVEKYVNSYFMYSLSLKLLTFCDWIEVEKKTLWDQTSYF